MADERRGNLLNIRASASEREQLRRVATERGTTVSGLIRQSLAAQGVQLER
jgi:type II secretory pathway component PulM